MPSLEFKAESSFVLCEVTNQRGGSCSVASSHLFIGQCCKLVFRRRIKNCICIARLSYFSVKTHSTKKLELIDNKNFRRGTSDTTVFSLYPCFPPYYLLPSNPQYIALTQASAVNSSEKLYNFPAMYFLSLRSFCLLYSSRSL